MIEDDAVRAVCLVYDAEIPMTDWPWYFDAEAKQKRHETVFPKERRKVFEMGAAIAAAAI